MVITGLDALGAAAAIAQFVDYAARYTRQAAQIYRSAEGAPRQVSELESMTLSLRALCDQMMSKCLRTPDSADVNSKAFVAVADSCKQTADEFLKLLDDLKIVGRRTVGKSLVLAFQAGRRQPSIEYYGKRIEQLRTQLHEQILSTMNDRQTALAAAFQRIELSNRRIESNLADTFFQHKQELIAIVSEKDGSSPGGSSLAATLAAVQEEGGKALRRQEVLASLYFDSMRRRDEQIKLANPDTYSWAFENSPSDDTRPPQLTTWLQHCSGIYWITGKAGSGKSTLMKYISDHAKTQSALKVWAGQRRLYSAAYYFWNPGTQMQKSLKGLLQSLLYDILRQCPDLIEEACPERCQGAASSTTSPWTICELGTSIKILSTHAITGSSREACFCFFVDGLDEYEGDENEGDHEDVVKQLLTFAESRNVKICVSSRPWEVFVELLEPCTLAGNRLDVHEHTRKDIEVVARAELAYHMNKRDGDLSAKEHLISEICDKAHGVFLWVVLVVKELIKGFRSADSISVLRKRLEGIPPGLDKYFDHIFRNIDPFYQRDTARIFLSCVHALEPLPANIFELPADPLGLCSSDDPEAEVLGSGVCHDYEWQNPVLLERLRKQINGRCKDLLEIPAKKTVGVYRVQFLHRTVKEFLDNADMAQLLIRRAGKGFDIDRLLCAAYILLAKKLPSMQEEDGGRELSYHTSTIALIHARASERRARNVMPSLLLDLDQTMASILDSDRREMHWTNMVYTDGVAGQPSRMHQEHGQRNFLGHLIELGLKQNVEILLGTSLDQKRGRPYLDYAIRPCLGRLGITDEDMLGPRCDLARLLMARGSSPNEKIWIYDGRTVFDVYLAYIYTQKGRHGFQEDITWALIEHGAIGAATCEVEDEEATAKYGSVVRTRKQVPTLDILSAVYGGEKAMAMQTLLSRNPSQGWLGQLNPLKWW